LKKLQQSLQSLAFRVLTLELTTKTETQGRELVRSIARLFSRLLIVLPSILLTGVSTEVFTILTDFYRDLTGRT